MNTRDYEMKKQKKRTMTLLEVMIVIFIIGIIGSVIGYNMRGSMDQGKAFKTKEGITKLYNIVHLEMDSNEIKALEGANTEEIAARIGDVLRDSGLINKPQQYLVDGWKNDLQFEVVAIKGGYEIRAKSEKYEKFYEKKSKSAEYPWDEEAADDS